MLDPYITVPLEAVAPSRYAATFDVPDRHGVFTFVVDWKRHGWTYIHTRDTAPVRPFNHDEYPRFLSSAWPYMAGSVSTVAAFLVFSTLWLATSP